MRPYPPLGTLYAAALVRQHGYSVALFDNMLAEREDEFRIAVGEHQPHVVVIYDDDFNYLTKMCLSRMRQAAFTMARVAREAGAIVIVHGSDSADHVAEYLSNGADYVVFGEGEQTLLALLGSILGDEAHPSDIKGIAYSVKGSPHSTPPRDVMRNLDALPFPARDLLDIERYRKIWRKRHGYFSTNIVTTRGCPFHCNWCAKPIYGQVYNSRSPENVAAEMLHLKETVKPDHVWFCDDIFGLKPGWLEGFQREISKRDAAIPFKCLARADLLLKDNAVDHLRNAGCETVWIGAESGSQRILDAMDKGTTVQQISDSTALLRSAGIKVGFFVQYGYPGETAEDIRLTLAMLKGCLPDDLGISVSYPLPGTLFYERVRAELTEKQNWLDSQDLDMMFRGTFSRASYRLLHRYTHKKLRFWQGLGIARQLPSRPNLISPRILRRLASAAYHAITLPASGRQLELLLQREIPAGSGGATND